MEIWIKHANLVDFPYDPNHPALNGMFTFDQQKVDNLVSEIMLASPTCYLVSGYRGAGKTSFIRRVQEGCLAKVSTHEKGQKGVLFVYSSFSRFENKTYFLRKLIRDLHEAAIGWESKKNNTVNQGLTDLYRKTFHEIKREHSTSTESEQSAEVSLDSKDFQTRLLKTLLPLLGTLTYEFLPTLWQQKIAAVFPPAKFLVFFITVIWAFIGALKVTAKYSIKKTNTDKLTSNDLNDDNITEYDLEHVLDTFRNENFKIVFVLDELDKIEETELDQLLREMKPWLVKGKADFILVAGQRLTMKYYSLKERDDELLASLFSKIVHVNPMTEQQLSTLFKDFLVIGVGVPGQKPTPAPMAEFNNEQAVLAASICNSLIYRSKRLPRTFMNLIRQELQWRNDEAFLPIPDIDFKLQETKMRILRRLFEKLALNADIAETGKSHLIMQLFRAAASIQGREPADLPFDKMMEDVVNPDGNKEPKAYPYPEIFPMLKACIQEFYKAAADEGIILLPREENTGTQPPMTRNIAPSPQSPTGYNIAPPPESPDHLALTAFIRDFDSFIQQLQSMAKDMVPHFDYNTDQTKIDQLFNAYDLADIIKFPFKTSVALQKTPAYYLSKQNDPKAFAQVFDLFTNNNVSFHNLFDGLFRKFTRFKLEDNFATIGTVRFSIHSTDPLADLRDFEIHINKFPEEIVVLVDYKFIDGAVAITSEEISRSISILEDYNITTGKGNYYLSIIFFKNFDQLDEAQLTLSAYYQIEKIRPDLADRIHYMIIPIASFNNLDALLAGFAKKIQPYTLTPYLSEKIRSSPPKTKKTKKKPTPSAAKTPSSSSASSSAVTTDPDDPQKGKWGGKPVRNGRELSAKVTKTEDPGWFKISLKVESLPTASNPLTGKVTFYLHNEFSPDKYTVMARDGIARVTGLDSYEAFTVGATCDNNTTRLELDLNDLPDIPPGFKY